MRINKAALNETTHEGAAASRINPEQALRRSLMACMLWEKTFYEEGEEIVKRISSLISKVTPYRAADLAIEAREDMKLRHVPLLVAREMARLDSHKPLVAMVLERIIQRPDELSEFLAIYWKDGRQPLSAQVKKGLAKAFQKFNEYSLAKYNQSGAVKLRDVLFLCHAKPKDKAQEKLWKKLISGELKTPDTWEVALSAGENKKEVWERLIKEGKLGALAFLRNLRNMKEAKVNESVILSGLKELKVDRVLPFRFIASARYASQWEPELEILMFKSVESHKNLKGKTILLVDVSGSMDSNLSGKSEMTRIDAASALAILLKEICEKVLIGTFSNGLALVPPRRGFALRDAIEKSQSHSGTNTGLALNEINANEDYDRIIVLTDEQSHDQIPSPKGKGYFVNVASYKNGIGYGSWTHIDGWSEAIVSYIQEYENEK